MRNLLKAKSYKLKANSGFTLIELLIVIGIIAVLMAIAIVAINPARQFAKANNARRWADVNTILNAVSQNIVDGRGTWTCGVALPSTPTNIGSATGSVDICSCLVPTYIGSMPLDPTAGTGVGDCSAAYSTGYNISQDATTGRVTVSAPNAQSENGTTPTISLTR